MESPRAKLPEPVLYNMEKLRVGHRLISTFSQIHQRAQEMLEDRPEAQGGMKCMNEDTASVTHHICVFEQINILQLLCL